jgi:hypothetical protein
MKKLLFLIWMKAGGKVFRMIVDRFGSLDAELSAILPDVLKLSPSEFTPLLMHLSREELIDRFIDYP